MPGIFSTLVKSILYPGLSLLAGCFAFSHSPVSTERSLTVLYTNDEHGWMEGMTPEQSAANLYGLWQELERYTPDGPFLVLSGGDNWTGPAVSTAVAGASMVEVMNTMNYAASAVGNHEFDFGLHNLQQRAQQAQFPYLSANTQWRKSGQTPVDIGIHPYTILSVNDLRVGVIGLTTTTTPRTTNPLYVESLQFNDYEQSLRKTVPEVRAAGVDMLFVVAHVCLGPLVELAKRVTDLDIQMMGGGHCNELAAQQVADTVVLGGGFHFTSYAKATFTYDLQRDGIVEVAFSVHTNTDVDDSPVVASLVQTWLQRVASQMQVQIGFNEEELGRRDPNLEQAIIDSWLWADPLADVAITNVGGIRTALPAGEITVGSIFNLMPFDNTIYAVTVTGAQLKRILRSGNGPIVAGVVARNNDWVLQRTQTALEDAAFYRVLVNSYMYAGGDNYEAIAESDAEGFDTGINYRQPFLDWVTAQATSEETPLRLATD